MLSKFLIASCATSARCAQQLAIFSARQRFVISNSMFANALVTLPSVPVNRRCFSTATLSVSEELDIKKLNQKLDDPEAEKYALEQQLSNMHKFDDSTHLKQTAASIRKALAECSNLKRDLLLAPNQHALIPWPTSLSVRADRMTLTDGNLKIMGRESFGELYRCVQNLIEQKTSIRRMNVMGTKGIGKSYQLAALVALLLKEGRRVVYLPHCGYSCSQLVSDMRDALLVAFGDDVNSAAFNRILQCDTKEQLLRVCRAHSLIFVFDHFNAVYEYSSIEIKTVLEVNARNFFAEISSNHLSVRGLSANNYTANMLAGKQRNEFDFFVFGGFTESEYQQWCQDHRKVFFCAASGSCDSSTEIDRRQLELRVASGGNPLMLHGFLVKYQTMISSSDSIAHEWCSQANDVFEACFKRWSNALTSAISSEMDAHFNSLIEANGPDNVEIMKQELLACVMGGHVSRLPTFFDHRHMLEARDFQAMRMPHTYATFIASPFLPSDWRNSESTFLFSSGIANMVGAEKLCTKFNAEKYFLGPYFIDYALKCFNPVVRGLQIERIVLAAIGKSGLDNVSVHSVQRFDARTLNVEYALMNHNVLYIPKGWNHPKFDAVLISWVPVQQDADQVGAIQSADFVAKRNSRKISTQPGANQLSAESPTSENLTSLSTLPKRKQSKRVLDHVKIQFIQISIAKQATTRKLNNTRSLVSCLRVSADAQSKSAESPECVSWRKVARVGADVPVRFSVRWLVSKDQIEQLKNSEDFDESFEKVSSLGPVLSALDVI